MNRPKKKMPDRAAPRPEPVTVTQVNAGLWRTALTLSGGDTSRITILSPVKVAVLNAQNGAARGDKQS